RGVDGSERRGDEMVAPALRDAGLMREQRAEILVGDAGRNERHQHRGHSDPCRCRPTALSRSCPASAHATPQQHMNAATAAFDRFGYDAINLANRLTGAARWYCLDLC